MQKRAIMHKNTEYSFILVRKSGGLGAAFSRMSCSEMLKKSALLLYKNVKPRNIFTFLWFCLQFARKLVNFANCIYVHFGNEQ